MYVYLFIYIFNDICQCVIMINTLTVLMEMH
jgi:hypothetical protein